MITVMTNWYNLYFLFIQPMAQLLLHNSGQTRGNDVSHTNDIQSSRISLDAGKSARSAVVDWVGGNEVRQQTLVCSSHPAEWCVFETCPRTVNDSYAMLHHSLPVTQGNVENK